MVEQLWLWTLPSASNNMPPRGPVGFFAIVDVLTSHDRGRAALLARLVIWLIAFTFRQLNLPLSPGHTRTTSMIPHSGVILSSEKGETTLYWAITRMGSNQTPVILANASHRTERYRLGRS